MTNKPNGFNFPAGNAGRVAWLVNTYAPQVDTGIEAAALQLALWEAAYETNGSLDIGNGAFSASTDSAVILQANIWLGTVGVNTSVARFFDYQGIGHGGQDMITIASVPEPMTLILLGSGLLGIVGFRKRFRR
jgi:hypothetical protein